MAPIAPAGLLVPIASAHFADEPSLKASMTSEGSPPEPGAAVEPGAELDISTVDQGDGAAVTEPSQLTTIRAVGSASPSGLASQLFQLTTHQAEAWASDKPLSTIIGVGLLVLTLTFSRLFIVVVCLAGGITAGYLWAQDPQISVWGPASVEASKDLKALTPAARAQRERQAHILAAADREVTDRITAAAAVGRLEAANILAASAELTPSKGGSLPPPVQRAWTRLADLVLRDFVDYWYLPLEVSKSGDLRRHVRSLLNRSVANLHARLRQDHVNLGVLISYAFANTLIVNLREYRQLELSGKDLDQYLVDNPGSLFNQLATHEAQIAHLLELARFLLARLLPAKDRDSPVIFAFLTEIVATNLLEPTVTSFCDPDQINMMIVSGLGTAAAGDTTGPTPTTTAPAPVPESTGDIQSPAKGSRLGAGLWAKMGLGLGGAGIATRGPTSKLLVDVRDCRLTEPDTDDNLRYRLTLGCSDTSGFRPWATMLRPATSGGQVDWDEHVVLTIPDVVLHSDSRLECTLLMGTSELDTRADATVTLDLQDIVHDANPDPQGYLLLRADGDIAATVQLAVYVEAANEKEDTISEAAEGYARLGADDLSPTQADFLNMSDYDLPTSETDSNHGTGSRPGSPHGRSRPTLPYSGLDHAVPADVDLKRLFPLTLDAILNQSDCFVEFMQYLEDQGEPPYLRFVMNVESYQRFARTLNDPTLMRDDAWSIFHLHLAPPTETTDTKSTSASAAPPYLIPVAPARVQEVVTTIRERPSPDCFDPILQDIHRTLGPHLDRFRETSPLYRFWLEEKWVKFARTHAKRHGDPDAAARARLAELAATPVALATHSPPRPPSAPPAITAEAPLSNATSPGTTPGAETARPNDAFTTEPTPAIPVALDAPSRSPTPSPRTSTSSTLPPRSLPSRIDTEVGSRSSSPVRSRGSTHNDERLAFITTAVAQLKEQIAIVDGQVEENERLPSSSANRTRLRQLRKSRADLTHDLDQLVGMAQDAARHDTHHHHPDDASPISTVAEPTEATLLDLRNVTVHVEEEGGGAKSQGAAQLAAKFVTSLGTRDSALIFIVECEQAASPAEGITQHGWMITRSYADFVNLHATLRQSFSKVDKIKFPSRQWGSSGPGSSMTTTGSGKQTALATQLQLYLTLLLSDLILGVSRPLQLFMKPDHMTVPQSFLAAVNPATLLAPGRGPHASSLMGRPGPQSSSAAVNQNGSGHALDVFNPRFITDPATQAASATSRTVNAAFRSASSALKRFTVEVGSPTLSTVSSPGSLKSLQDQRRRASNASLNAGRTGAGSPAGPGMAAHGMFNKAAPPSVSGRLNRKLGDGIDDAVSSPPTGTTLHTINSDTTAAAASIPPSSSEPSLLLSAAGAPTLDTPPSDKTTSAFATTHSISTAPRKVEVPLLKSPTSNPPRRSSLASTPMASSVSAPPPSGFPRPDTSSTTGTVSHKALRPEEIELLIETFFALMDEVFDLKDTKQWLRRKALAVFKQLLRQSYASTISTVFVDTVTKYTEPALLADRIDQLTTSFWPNGTWYATPITDDPSSPSLPVVRTEEQKEATKLEARVLFVNHMPEALQRMVGEYNGVMGMTRLFELLQRPELVRPIAIKLLDSICKLVLSELQD